MTANTVAVLITDERMPGVSGSQLLADVANLYPNQVRIMLTGHADMSALINALNEGYLFKFLRKPWDEQVLSASIEEAFELYKRKMELLAKEQELQNLKAELDQDIEAKLKNKLNPNGGDLNFKRERKYHVFCP